MNPAPPVSKIRLSCSATAEIFSLKIRKANRKLNSEFQSYIRTEPPPVAYWIFSVRARRAVPDTTQSRADYRMPQRQNCGQRCPRHDKIDRRLNLAWRRDPLQDKLIHNEARLPAVFTPVVRAKSLAPADGTAQPAAWIFGMSTIVGLFTDMLSTGGVQRAGRHVAAVASKLAAERGNSYRFLSLNDPQGLHTVRVGSSEFVVSGYAHAKSQFVFAALKAAGRKPSLVIALHPHLAPIVRAMTFRSRKFRSIVFAHGIEVWQPLGWPRGAALRRADLVIGPSSDTVQHLITQQGIRAEKVQRLPWGLDPEFEARLAAGVSTSLPAGFPRNGKVILTVGRWDPAERYKGADTIIAALPRVLQTAPDAFLVLIGGGEDRPRLEQLARDRGVSDRAAFLQNLSPDELFACYAACNVFALPSRGEGFGLVFLEAMAHGKPVIGGEHGGTPDVIENAVTGLLVPHGDVERLSTALETLLLDPQFAGRMGTRGLERVRAEYTFEKFESELRRIVHDVLRNG
jgi:phosphatidyl-myo-inositol dimannoside synthase